MEEVPARRDLGVRVFQFHPADGADVIVRRDLGLGRGGQQGHQGRGSLKREVGVYHAIKINGVTITVPAAERIPRASC